MLKNSIFHYVVQLDLVYDTEFIPLLFESKIAVNVKVKCSLKRNRQMAHRLVTKNNASTYNIIFHCW